jgi:hypothetical protein
MANGERIPKALTPHVMIEHPGVRGVRWQRTPDGKIRYGKAAEGQQYEAIPQLGSEHVQPGHKVMYETSSGQHHGQILGRNATFATVAKDDGETHAAVPYRLLRSVDPPGPQDMKLGVDMLFEHQGARATGKVLTWGPHGVRAITASGEIVAVSYKALHGVPGGNGSVP